MLSGGGDDPSFILKELAQKQRMFRVQEAFQFAGWVVDCFNLHVCFETTVCHNVVMFQTSNRKTQHYDKL